VFGTNGASRCRTPSQVAIRKVWGSITRKSNDTGADCRQALTPRVSFAPKMMFECPVTSRRPLTLLPSGAPSDFRSWAPITSAGKSRRPIIRSAITIYFTVCRSFDHFKFHYDEALSRLGIGKGFVVTSWDEMKPDEVAAAPGLQTRALHKNSAGNFPALFCFCLHLRR